MEKNEGETHTREAIVNNNKKAVLIEQLNIISIWGGRAGKRLYSWPPLFMLASFHIT